MADDKQLVKDLEQMKSYTKFIIESEEERGLLKSMIN